MIIHYVEMDEIRARGDYRTNLFPKPSEIGGKDAWCDAKLHAAHCIPGGGDPIGSARDASRYNGLMAQEKHYEVVVGTTTRYLADQSDELADRYVFSYTITIRNAGNATAQLISRHWIITDARGQVQEVRGLGVVGAQPTLKPGESFEYTSGTSIATPVGTMRGTYQMVGEDGSRFDAVVPEFTLSVPRVLH
jgi:ApaG protein